MAHFIPWPVPATTFPILDRQMASWSDELSRDVRVHTPISKRLVSTIAGEVAALAPEEKAAVLEAGPVLPRDRLDELVCFQAFMDHIHEAPPDPALVRAQVITQNYVCFVYLGESCFKVLRKALPSGSAGRKCAVFLTDNPIRAFRNAVAHANWRYLPGYGGLEFWARKGDAPNEPLSRWQVSQASLGFWQALARVTAYATYLTLTPAPWREHRDESLYPAV